MNAIITTVLSGVLDPQRKLKWKVDHSVYQKLYDSCKRLKIHLIVLSDKLSLKEEEGLSVVRTEAKINPYFQRWKSIHDYLEKSNLQKVYCVDATDVEVFNNPFDIITENNLVVGCEEGKLGCDWILNKHKNLQIKKFINANYSLQLLNAGIVGGNVEVVKTLCISMSKWFNSHGDDYTDMPRLNYILRGWEIGGLINLEYGSHINTAFKKYEQITEKNKNVLFRHK